MAVLCMVQRTSCVTRKDVALSTAKYRQASCCATLPGAVLQQHAAKLSTELSYSQRVVNEVPIIYAVVRYTVRFDMGQTGDHL